jgi:hypothetical protein
LKIGGMEDLGLDRSLRIVEARQRHLADSRLPAVGPPAFHLDIGHGFELHCNALAASSRLRTT